MLDHLILVNVIPLISDRCVRHQLWSLPCPIGGMGAFYEGPRGGFICIFRDN